MNLHDLSFSVHKFRLSTRREPDG